MNILKLSAVALATLGACFAVETRFWEQGDRADFEKGTLHHLSLRSDGRIFLAPEFSEIFDSSTPYLWAISADSKGNLYTAGGGSGPTASTSSSIATASSKFSTWGWLASL